MDNQEWWIYQLAWRHTLRQHQRWRPSSCSHRSWRNSWARPRIRMGGWTCCPREARSVHFLLQNGNWQQLPLWPQSLVWHPGWGVSRWETNGDHRMLQQRRSSFRWLPSYFWQSWGRQVDGDFCLWGNSLTTTFLSHSICHYYSQVAVWSETPDHRSCCRPLGHERPLWPRFRLIWDQQSHAG